jgi:flagellar hook-basal body complex protein FliE
MAFDPILPPVGLNSDLLWRAEAVGQAKKSPSTFGSILAQAIGDVQSSAALARESADSFLRGENQELHEVAIAGQKAELTMEMFLQSRNKLVQAYQEIMRMQI